MWKRFSVGAGVWMLLGVVLLPAPPPQPPPPPLPDPVILEPFAQRLSFSGDWQKSWTLAKGQAFDISVRIDDPEALPPNGRLDVIWEGPELTQWSFEGERGDLNAKASANWSKTLYSP